MWEEYKECRACRPQRAGGFKTPFVGETREKRGTALKRKNFWGREKFPKNTNGPAQPKTLEEKGPWEKKPKVPTPKGPPFPTKGPQGVPQDHFKSPVSPVPVPREKAQVPPGD